MVTRWDKLEGDMMRLLIASLALGAVAAAQSAGTNYDESKVPRYTLPELLVLKNGTRVRDAKAWQTRRRPEVFGLLETRMFGRAPGRPEQMSFELTSVDRNALGGKAVRKEIAINLPGQTLDLLLYLPANAHGKVPVFVGLNFNGNQAIDADPGIRPARVWRMDPETRKPAPQTAAPESRGSAAHRWQLEKILARGYGLATMYYGDIEPDFDGMIQSSVRARYLKGRTAPAPDEWGAIAAWAWGLSRAVDYLETDPGVDAKRIAVMGHSRLGKTALWAGAADQRFALVISNDSGEGGAAISRRVFGETVKDLNTRFPHWFCANYKQYSGREGEMPFDSHMLIALIAPRPVYVASAQEDKWADPKGEFLGAVAAGPVYALFGEKGIETETMPGIHQPVGDAVRYHIRAGKHDVTEYDWEQYLNFADRHLGAAK
jgi:hypothetical protein